MSSRLWALIYVVWLAVYAGMVSAFPDTMPISIAMFVIGASLLCVDLILFVRAWIKKRT